MIMKPGKRAMMRSSSRWVSVLFVIDRDNMYKEGRRKGTNAVGNIGSPPQCDITRVPPASVNVSSKLMARPGALIAFAEDEPESSPDDRDDENHPPPRTVSATSSQTHRPGTVTLLCVIMNRIQEAIG